MSCFFSCFGAKHNKLDFEPTYAVSAVYPPRAIAKARVSRNQLSDLFVSKEVEEVSYSQKSPQFESVDIHSKGMSKVVNSNELPDHTWTPPARPGELEKVLDSQEESPTSCVSDPPSASRNSVNTTGKNSHAIQKLKNGHASWQKDMQVQGNMSSGLKTGPYKRGVSKVNNQCKLAAYGHTCRSPRDRPILRTITAQWNEEVDPSNVPLKWWDGNGIPNSTNKYREDQIVSWDGTPFEERLEKALSDANSIAQRKHFDGADDSFGDEIDTAASKLQSLPHPKSVVLF